MAGPSLDLGRSSLSLSALARPALEAESSKRERGILGDPRRILEGSKALLRDQNTIFREACWSLLSPVVDTARIAKSALPSGRSCIWDKSLALHLFPRSRILCISSCRDSVYRVYRGDLRLCRRLDPLLSSLSLLWPQSVLGSRLLLSIRGGDLERGCLLIEGLDVGWLVVSPC